MNAISIMTMVLSNAGFTVYPIAVPQTAKPPFAVLNLVSERANTRLDDAAGQYEARVSVACHHTTPAALMDMSEAMKRVLESATQTPLDDGQSPPAKVVVNIFKDVTDITDFSDDRTIFRRIVDWRVQWWIFK